ncbi:hypothetical protein MMC29_007659 [Sticta canariensis]|nr:hypothetical protein [Sticta canariensis]
MRNGHLGRPNEEQHSALQTLHRFSNEVIQWFLIYARSVEYPPQDQPSTQHKQDVLTDKELDAIRILRRYPDVSAALIPSNGSQGDGHSTPNRIPNIVSWCTYCSPPRQFKRKDSWARHEREMHEEHRYPCMPNGAVESTEHGLVCAICRTKDPDDIHLNKHNIGLCGNPSSTHVCTRRRDLVKHLNTDHGVPNGQRLAEDWKRAPDKRAWACGFCVSYFPQFMDRINHIHTEHYARGEHIGSWDPVKVIQGLLCQPRLNEKWSAYLLAGYPSPLPDVTWHASVVNSLQGRLEMEKEPPNILVAAAFDQSNLRFGCLGSELLPSIIDADQDPMDVDMPSHFPQTSIAPQDSSQHYNRSNTSHESGSSKMDMAGSPDFHDLCLDSESTERSTQHLEPPIHQTSRRSSQQLNETVLLDDLVDTEEVPFDSRFFDEAYGEANA